MDYSKKKVIDLSHPLTEKTPYSPNASGFQRVLHHKHGDKVMRNHVSFAADIISTGTHVGTHIDAVGHFSYKEKLYSGANALEAQIDGSLVDDGIHSFPPFYGRGVFLDVAKHLGVDCLAPAQRIDRELLQQVAQSADLQIAQGDAVLIRSGWDIYFQDAKKFLGAKSGVPGITEDAAYWLAELGVSVVGGETIALEVIPPNEGMPDRPVHRVLLTEYGIPIIEVMNLRELSESTYTEFLLVVSPLNMTGATGSPVRPLAVVDLTSTKQ